LGVTSGFFQLSREGICRHTNGEAGRLTGYSAEEMKGNNWLKVIHPEDRDVVDNIWRNCNEKQDNHGVEFRVLRKDGKVVWVFGQITPFLDDDRIVLGYIATLTDITSKKQAEKELKLSEERFSKAFKASPNMVAILRLSDNRFVDANDSFLNAAGYRREEIIGCTINDLIFWADPQTPNKIANLLQEKEKVKKHEIVFIAKSDQVRTGLLSMKPIELNGEDCLLVLINDMTEQNLSKIAIELERQRLFTVLHNLPANIALVKQDYTVRFANKSFCKSFGESFGKRCYEALYERQTPCEACRIDKIFEEWTPDKWEQLHNGCPYQVYGYPFHDIDGTPLVLTMSIDISELKQLKEEMLRLDRLNLIGEMAAGIGHEIRNPMTTVRGFLQYLGEKKECARYSDSFDLMIVELDRANAIITEYLSLAKNKAIEPKKQNLNFIVKSLFPIIQADAMLTDKDVKLVLGNIPDTYLDEKEIRQLILNLARNGLEAMSPGGTLTIKTYMEDDTVVLEVQDKGRGIAPDVLKKLGTPFFTTKDNGTGLGLAVCYSIATRHKAKIEVKTGAGGSVFAVRFQRSNSLAPQQDMMA